MTDVKMIEMVAYQSAHTAEGVPWRCMLCEKLTKHTEEGVIPHLIGAHNISKDNILKERDGLFIRVNDTKEDVSTC